MNGVQTMPSQPQRQQTTTPLSYPLAVRRLSWQSKDELVAAVDDYIKRTIRDGAETAPPATADQHQQKNRSMSECWDVSEGRPTYNEEMDSSSHVIDAVQPPPHHPWRILLPRGDHVTTADEDTSSSTTSWDTCARTIDLSNMFRNSCEPPNALYHSSNVWDSSHTTAWASMFDACDGSCDPDGSE